MNTKKLVFRSIAFTLCTLPAIIFSQTPGSLKWTFDLGGRVQYANPAIASDGTIYIGTDDYSLYALNANGTLKWKFATNGYLRTSPAIAADGTIYVGSNDKNLYALTPAGTLKWAFNTLGVIRSSPAIGADGTVYVGSNDYKLYAINPDGTEKWAYALPEFSNMESSPAIGPDGTIYVGSDFGVGGGFYGSVFAFSPEGDLKWRFDTEDDVSSSPAIGLDGTIYVGSDDDYMYAINPDGTQKWRYFSGSSFDSPVIAVDSTVYIGSSRTVYAFSPNGERKWSFYIGSTIRSAPLVGADGTLYVGSTNGKLYALNAAGEKVWEYNTSSSIYSSPVMDQNGVLYFGTFGKQLFAVYGGNQGLANSPWPKFHKNNFNDGNSYNAAYPVAKIDKSVTTAVPGAQFDLDGSASYDADGGAVSYQWSVIFSSSGEDKVSILNATAAKTGVIIHVPGHYKLSLKVVDSDNHASYDVIEIATGLVWTHETGGRNTYSSPAIAADGTIYFGSDDNNLYAVKADGTRKWTFLTNGSIQATPAIAADGTIYVGSFDKNLYAIAANGSQKWAFNTLGEIKSSAAIASDGTIYVGSNDNKLYSINPDGTQKWTFETGNFGPVESSPAIGPDGTIYVGSDYGAVSGKSGSLFALNPDGSVKWRFDVEDNVFASPAIGVDGTVYLGSDDDYVYAVNPDGTQKWRYYTGGGYSSPVVGADSTIYVGSKDNRILAINPDGTRKWSFTTSDDIFSSPLVGSDGVIYIGCDDYHIYAITPAGEQKWQYNTGDRITSSPTMAADGTLYCVNYSGKLFALTSGSTAIANSPWPKFRRSMHNDGNAFDQSYPVAKIARNISTAIPGEEFELDGSASIDGDGGSLVYEWAVTEASSGQDKVSFLSPNAARTRVVIRVPGFYKISLKVTDSAGQASYDVIAIEAGIKWTYQTGGSYYYSTTPALGNDGLIYLTSSGENNLYAVKPDGQLAWTFTTNRSATSPAVAEDGTIYLGSNDKNLYAITPQGTQKWAFTTLGEIHSSAAIGPDGTIYVGSNDSRLYAINPDGTQKWSFTTGDYGSVQSSPAIGLDGTIYFGSDYGVGSGKYGSLFALNPNGTLKWRFDADDDITSSPAIGLDGTIYVNSDDDYFYAINPDGTLKWRSFNGGGISSPVIGPDSTIYVGSKNNALYAYTPHGTRKWTYYLKDDVTSTPLVGADGTIFFGCSDQKFYALTPEGKVKWTYDTGDRILCSPTMSTDGTLYFMTRSGKMYAMYSGSQGMANTPWPKFHQNVRNTGQLDALILMDEMKFAFVNVGSPFSKTVQIINASANAIDIQTAEFEHAAFSLQTALPLSIPSNSSSIVTVHILPEKSAFYQSSMELTFTTAGKNKHASSNLEAGLFLEDGSETAVIAHQALDMYEKSKTEDPKSIATENNLGVLYRLLGEPEIASSYLKDALSQSLNKLYGFDGISLNVGVTESDMNKPQAAKQYYAFSLSNNSGTITKKAYYNLALDAYKQDSLEVAASHVQQTLIGATANDFLKAKAYVLRGAIRYRQGDVTAAINDFEQAIRLDPGGPIARMAEENREIITSVEESGEPQTVPSVFVLLPNYPNPFNPETVVSFGLPVNSEVELVIFNVVGQKVVTLLKEQKIAGWHNVTWNGTNKNGVPVSSGIYLLQMKASEFKHVYKMTLLR